MMFSFGSNDEWNELFKEFWGPNSFVKKDDCYSTKRIENGFQINFKVPGFTKEDLSINLEDKHLIVKGIANKKNPYSYDFCKIIRFNEPISTSISNAKFENGILSISVLKDAEKINSTKLEIN